MAEEKITKKPKDETASPANKVEKSAAARTIAVVLVRGLIGIRKDTKDTLFMLRLRKKHACAIIKETPILKGMLQKTKDFTAYGPVSDATVAELKKARKPLNEKGSLVFNLAPPRGGYERGGIKKTFAQGGALGVRKEMDTLLKKMM